MYSTADFAVTPRPIYPADGRKIPDIYTQPAELRDELQRAARRSSRCSTSGDRAPDIASRRGSPTRASHVSTRARPTLTLVYLPHLDYDLQRLGPSDPRDRRGCARSTRSPAS